MHMQEKIDLINYIMGSKRLKITLYDGTVHDGRLTWLGNNWFRLSDLVNTEPDDAADVILAYSDVMYAEKY